MYAKALAGLIKGFTGIDDPYDTSQRDELALDTAHETTWANAQSTTAYVKEKGFLAAT